MAENSMNVQVYSPSKPLAEITANSVSVPGSMGFMEILPDHTAMVAEIGCGHLCVTKKDGNEKLNYFVSGGYVDVCDNSIKVLVDVAEIPDDIDRTRAEAALKRADERLKKVDAKVELARAQYAHKRAQERIKLISKL